MIQIKSPTYDRINDEFIYESRGTVDVKGNGEMEVFLMHVAKDMPLISMSLQ
jgi:hypothetical protein